MSEYKYISIGDLDIETFDDYFCANDVINYHSDVNSCNKKRTFSFFKNKKTRTYISSLNDDRKYITHRGGPDGSKTYMCKELFYFFLNWFKDDKINFIANMFLEKYILKAEGRYHKSMYNSIKNLGLGNEGYVFYHETKYIKSIAGNNINDNDYDGLINDLYLMNSFMIDSRLDEKDRHLHLKNHATSFWIIKNKHDSVKRLR